MAEAFALLVPVKALSAAKSRLGLDAAVSRELMAAFVRDAVAAARRSPLVTEVFLVSDERLLAEETGAGLLADEGQGDLNRALAAAAGRVASGRPALGVAAMCADLPCLVEDDLSAALSRQHAPRWCVADAAGTGTTLLAAAPGLDLGPAFGPGSAAAHVASGARALSEELATLRLDVDTTSDLQRAVRLGVGPHTAAALASLRVA